MIAPSAHRKEEVRAAFTTLTRSLKRVSLYRHARGQYASFLASALAALQQLLADTPHLTLSVEPGALLYEGEPVHRETAREGSLCFRLHRDGLRTLTFSGGLDLAELITFADVALPDGALDSHEDAVTELWKAGLKSIAWTAVSGYRLDPGETGATILEESAQRARDVLEYAPVDDDGPPPPLMTEEERCAFDPHEWGELGASVCDILARIVERGFAGKDLASLGDSFARICEQMVRRGEHPALLGALRRAANLTGNAAAEFRKQLGTHLAARPHLAAALDLSRRIGLPAADLIPVWLDLLPEDAGETALSLVEDEPAAPARAALARAAVIRARSCKEQLSQALAQGRAPVVQALLDPIRELPAAQRTSLAASALANPSSAVRLTALSLIGRDAATPVALLGPLLHDDDPPVRIAAAEALGACAASRDAAVEELLGAITRPGFAGRHRDEQTTFFRAMGGLGASRGRQFLCEQLLGSRRTMLARSREDRYGLLAVRGLAADGSVPALSALEEAAHRQGPVGAACRGAIQMLRGRTAA